MSCTVRRIARVLLIAATALGLGAAAAEAPDVDARYAAAEATLQRLMEEKRYEEAAQVAADLVTLSGSVASDQSLALARALTGLGMARLNQGELREAEQHLRSAVRLIEEAEGPGSPALMQPLLGLAETHRINGDLARANAVYQRTLVLNNATSGFYNPEQLPILDALAETFLALNQIDKANIQQRRQVLIQQRRFGDDDPQFAQAMFKLGHWYNRTGQQPAAHQTFQEARRIIQQTGGKRDPALVDALIGEALTYTSEGDLASSVAMLNRALDVLDAQPTRDPLKRADVLVALGDLNMVFRRTATAREHYGEAWRSLDGEDPALAAQREAYFARPARIAGPLLPKVVDADGRTRPQPRSGAGYANGSISVRFSVDVDGLARDPVIVEAIPAGLIDRKVLRAITQGVYRPRLVDGVSVATAETHLHHSYRYLRAAEEKPRDSDRPESRPLAPPDEPAHGNDPGAP